MKGSLLFRKVCKDSAASLIVTVSVETVLYDISIGMKTSSDTGQTAGEVQSGLRTTFDEVGKDARVFVLDLGRGSYTIRSKDKVNATFKLSEDPSVNSTKISSCIPVPLEWYSVEAPVATTLRIMSRL